MSLANKPLDQITKADLQELIDNQVEEGKEYDYKLQLWSKSDADKKEFRYDVSSFANTVGGHLIVGMDEAEGIPTAIVGLRDDMDKTILDLESMLRAKIAPRIQGIGMRAIPVDSGNVLVIRIPRSWSAPHMVTFDDNSRFYARHSRGKYLLDVGELRAAFTLSETATERIRNFRLDRIAKIAADDTPITLSKGAKFVLHIAPLGTIGSVVDFSSLSLDKRIEWQSKFNQPIVITRHRYNSNGLLFSGTSISTLPREKYIQIFRDGAFEFVDTWLLNNEVNIIPSNYYERIILELMPIVLSIQEQLGFQPPFIIMLSLLGVKGYTIASITQFGLPIRQVDYSIDRDNLLIPDIAIDNFNSDLSKSLKDMFDMVWQSCGVPQSKNYDQEGNWKPAG